MKKIIITMLLMCALPSFAASNALITKNFGSDDINQSYFYVKLPVEINYEGEKVFADKDTPLVVEDRFKWKSVVDYNSCSTRCGSGNFAITYSCEKSDLYGKEIVFDDLCVAKIGAKPVLPGPACVNWDDCGQGYTYTEWRACDGGATESTREAICKDRNENILPNEACASLQKEELTRICSYPSSCKEVLIANPAAATGFYTLSPNGANTYSIYCEMDFEGGGWIVLGHSGPNYKTPLTSSPGPGGSGFLAADIMKKFASNASQVAFSRIDYNQYIVSVADAYPIQQLRLGNGMMRVGTNHTYWISPQGLVTSTRFNRVCGGGGTYQDGYFLWACGNESGIHFFSNVARWAYNGSAFQVTMMIR